VANFPNSVPEFIDPRFRENKPKKRSCAVIENERFGLVFAKTGSIISGTVVLPVDDIGLADHLIEPVLDGGVLAPPLLRALVGDAVHRNLVTLSML
jgi:hypothetical protein